MLTNKITYISFTSLTSNVSCQIGMQVSNPSSFICQQNVTSSNHYVVEIHYFVCLCII